MIVLSGDKYTKEKTNKWLLNTCFFKKNRLQTYSEEVYSL
ncbi:hypothetical protein HMPREF9447_00799 [Bacteroides oleiciplenus YIT 12058]|uniref:Uncharacterized protein n=1 Tax=Bacteroides oleiciplenus YIT 12058 TaxID=742727 RepID=K9E5C9_9BACE|nr:hypothetical protein HMPREF9447_00799 [Bacteroides oleiciplenus YIT 12058]